MGRDPDLELAPRGPLYVPYGGLSTIYASMNVDALGKAYTGSWPDIQWTKDERFKDFKSSQDVMKMYRIVRVLVKKTTGRDLRRYTWTRAGCKACPAEQQGRWA